MQAGSLLWDDILNETVPGCKILFSWQSFRGCMLQAAQLYRIKIMMLDFFVKTRRSFRVCVHPRAGIVACFCCFDLPQFRGARLAAVACLLWLFGAAGLACTYLLSFAFSVRACTRRACSGNGSPLLLHALAQTFSRAC